MNERQKKLAGDIPPAIDGVAAGIEEGSFHGFEETVERAADFSSAADLSSPVEFHQYLAEAAAKDPEAYAGWFARLKGYVGEQVAAEDLSDAGHVIQWPDTPNNPGWDLLVDGSPYNVKVTDSVQAVREHLTNHPGIGVITGPATAEHLDPGLRQHVLALDDLSNEALTQKTQGAIDAATSGNLHLSLPIATLIFSSLYELSKLADGKSNLKTSGASIALDVAGAGLGGALGTTACMTACAAMFPWMGPLLPAIAGGVAGRVAGKRLAGLFKPEWKHGGGYMGIESKPEEVLRQIFGHEGRYLWRDIRTRFHALSPPLQAFASRLPELFASLEPEPTVRYKREVYLTVAMVLRDRIQVPLPMILAAIHGVFRETDPRILEDGAPMGERLIPEVRKILLGVNVEFRNKGDLRFARVISVFIQVDGKNLCRSVETERVWEELPESVRLERFKSGAKPISLTLLPVEA